jgi:hypothetical protein
VVGYQLFRGPCYLHLQGEVTGSGEENSIDRGLELKRAATACVVTTTVLHHPSFFLLARSVLPPQASSTGCQTTPHFLLASGICHHLALKTYIYAVFSPIASHFTLKMKAAWNNETAILPQHYVASQQQRPQLIYFQLFNGDFSLQSTRFRY